MIILVDMDEVLCSTIEYWLNEYNYQTGDTEHVTPEDIKSHKAEQWVQNPELLMSIMDGHDFFQSLPPIHQGPETIKALTELGHQCIIVSAIAERFKDSERGKRQWVEDHMPWFSQENIVFTRHKYLVRGDLLIDDRAENIVTYPGRVLLFARPHNKSLREDNIFPTVLSWAEAFVYIQTLDLLLNQPTRRLERMIINDNISD